MNRNKVSLWFAVAGFIVLVIVSYFINRSDAMGELTWFWGTISLFAIWPIEVAIFTYAPEGFIRHISGATILAAMLILTNFLQTGTLTWSAFLATACVLWPIGYVIFWLIERKTKSALLGSLIGWLGVSAIAILTEFLAVSRLTWSLPFAVLLAFWPAAFIAFPNPVDTEDDTPYMTPSTPEEETETEGK